MFSHSPLGGPELLIEVDLPDSPAATAVVTMTGEIDADNCAEVQRAVTDVLDRVQAAQVILDMGQVTFLGSAGIRALLSCRRAALHRGTGLKIGRAHQNVSQVLAITGLLDAFCMR
jgi:anti-anti-sigma factor